MKLELADILDRVGRTESERSVYRNNAAVWERMWQLKAFNRTTKQAIEQDGQEQVTLPTPFNIVQLATRLISSTPKIDIPATEVTADADKVAVKCERWLNAMWQQANRQQQRNIIADATWQVLVRGKYCFEVKWIGDELPAALKKRRMPILIRTLDPLNVGIKRGPLYTLWAYHKYEDEKINIRSRYPKLKFETNRRDYRGVSDEDTTCTVIDYWWRNESDGSVWNAIIVDETFAKKPVKTDYPEIPIIEGSGDGAPLDSEDSRSLSILHPIKDLWPYQCRLASQMATGLLWYFWPPITVQNEMGTPVDDIQIGPGKTTPTPWGTKIDMHQLSPNVPLAQAMDKTIQQASEQSTFPGVMYGQSPGDLQAGFGISLLSDQAKGRIKAFVENLEFGIAQVCELALGLVKEFGKESGVDVWGKDERNGGTFRLTLAPKEIGDINEAVVSLKPQVSQDTMQKQTLGLRLVEAKIISRRTYQAKYADMALPDDEQARIELEQAMDSDPMKPIIADAALRKYFGDDWKAVLGLTMPPEPPFGPPPSTGSGAGGPPPGPNGPPMPPGGPPPGMMPPPPPQGPPGPPPQMQGPPPGMMPPQGPPGGQQIPPEILAAMMAQQGQGGPPGIPPGQSPQMLTPPMGGGIPAEVQGQITPEAMNMAPNTDPQTFAALTGQQIPPAEELRMIAGKKSVGHKREKK